MSTQNLTPYFVGGNPLQYYKPNQIPFETVAQSHKTSSANNMDDLIHHIQKHRKSSGKSDIPKEDIREHLLKVAGSGFWDDIYGGLKSIGSKVAEGVGDLVSHPLQTAATVAPLFL